MKLVACLISRFVMMQISNSDSNIAFLFYVGHDFFSLLGVLSLLLWQ